MKGQTACLRSFILSSKVGQTFISNNIFWKHPTLCFWEHDMAINKDSGGGEGKNGLKVRCKQLVKKPEKSASYEKGDTGQK